MRFISILEKNQNKILFYSIITFIIIVFTGVILRPDIFYDQWIWKYYWGPIVADANPDSASAIFNGVVANEGYTIISEITYGIILIFSLFGIYKLLKKLEITIDWRFALALLPYIVFGPVSRSLEDSSLFSEPVVYWFISPLIYVQIAIYALLFILLGYFLERKLKLSKITVNKSVFFGGLLFLIPSLIYTGIWIFGNQWSETPVATRFDVFLIVIVITSLIVGVVYLIARKFKDNKKILVYKSPLNLAMLFGHLIDGITSYISIHVRLNMGLHFSEIHPASDMILNIWGPLFPIVKFILIIIVIYVFDVLYKDELKNYMNLVNLLKIGILILGFSPGLRDLLRVTMGV